MTTITNYFEQAQLSMAAYAPDLQRGAFGSQNTDYVAALRFAGMSQTQAEAFANTYSVLNQTQGPYGFSATLFADQNGGLHVAIRGTDSILDWIGTNFGDIGVDGIAVRQGIALFNWLQQLVTPAGQPAPQVQYVTPVYETDPFTGAITLCKRKRTRQRRSWH